MCLKSVSNHIITVFFSSERISEPDKHFSYRLYSFEIVCWLEAKSWIEYLKSQMQVVFAYQHSSFKANRKQDDPEYTSSLVLTLHWKMILESFRNVVVFSYVFKNFLKRFQAKFYRIFFIAKEFYFSGRILEKSILSSKLTRWFFHHGPKILFGFFCTRKDC